MGQVQTNGRGLASTTRAYQASQNEQFYNKRIEHEGLIKLRAVPFKNCIQIQTQSSSIFLQNIEITLKDLLDSRLYTNKLFPKEDIERLIQNVTYTLAYLQQNSVPYKDVSAQNIFYDEGSFKLLPNQLIPQSRYNKFLQSRSKRPNSQQTTQGDSQFVPLSPEMIIAYRCKQSQIVDFEILDKSNVFYLGLLLLQTTTLLPAHECYDTDTCDILDEVVSERIQMIKDYYSDQIASIVANMLDYDYVERMNLKDISIFVNRELNREITLNSKIGKELSNKKQSRQLTTCEPVCSQPLIDQSQSITNHSHCKTGSIISKSRVETSTNNEGQSRISKHQQTGTISQKKRSKNNKVYMNGTIEQISQEQESTFTRQERNKVYMKQPSTADLKKSHVNQTPKQNQRPTSALRQNSNANNLNQPTGKIFNMNNQRQKFTPSIPEYTQKSYLQNVNNQEDEENRYPSGEQYQQKGLKRKNSTDYLGYRAANGTTMTKTPKRVDYHQRQSQFQYAEQVQEKSSKPTNYGYKQQNDYNYGPSRKQGSFGHRFVQKQSFSNQESGSKGYFDVNKPMGANSKVSLGNNQYKDHNHSLSRIKSQIQRSRKLIEQFKRGQNCHF